jgi:hypothetical protein
MLAFPPREAGRNSSTNRLQGDQVHRRARARVNALKIGHSTGVFQVRRWQSTPAEARKGSRCGPNLGHHDPCCRWMTGSTKPPCSMLRSAPLSAQGGGPRPATACIHLWRSLGATMRDRRFRKDVSTLSRLSASSPRGREVRLIGCRSRRSVDGLKYAGTGHRRLPTRARLVRNSSLMESPFPRSAGSRGAAPYSNEPVAGIVSQRCRSLRNGW